MKKPLKREKKLKKTEKGLEKFQKRVKLNDIIAG
jgi:hypothetical protein